MNKPSTESPKTAKLKRIWLLRVLVQVDGFRGILFTGKLVKSILIRAYPQLRDVFKPSEGSTPKLVHVTPLYASRGDSVKCIYSYVVCKPMLLVKCEGPPKHIELNGDYYFYFGFHETIAEMTHLLSNIMNYGECFEFMNQRICVETKELNVYDPHALGLRLVDNVLQEGGLKVKFSSPTMLRDPLRTSGKYKTLLPSPFNVFAAPVYIILYTKGLFSVRRLRTELLRLHRLFNETYSALGGLRVRWVYYGRRPEPALVGYVNYRVNYEYLDFLRQKLNVEEWLGEVFAYALALGVGAGRATGFGHVEIKPLAEGNSARNQGENL
ncbi:MAG: CRISPR system precrRNA processing endoribonuclease RAMP protein Cas6 [Thermosphaera sp.]